MQLIHKAISFIDSELKYLLALLCITITPINYAFAQSSLAAYNYTYSPEKFLNAIQANAAIFSYLNATLTENGLPKALSNLALIESDLNRNAISKRNAGGIWQFTIEHAADFGLSPADRFDIYKSTQAAVKSLKKLHAHYNNWIAVVAAYNCGEGNVDNAIKKAGSRKYENYALFLPNETINHVLKFMDACYATNDIQMVIIDYHFAPPTTDSGGVESDTGGLIATEINSGFDIKTIASMMQIDKNSLLKWNPGIEETLSSKGRAQLYLPVDIMPNFQLLKTKILQASLNAFGYE